MYKPLSRKFTLLDAMILIGATAVGFACARAVESWINAFYAFLNPNILWLRFHVGVCVAGVFLAIWSVTLLGIGTRWTLAGIRRSLQQPGTTACAASTLIVLSILSAKTLWAASHRSRAFHPASWADTGAWGPQVGGAVAIAWLVLAACERWHTAPDWIERAGRGIGIGWIALGIVDAVFRNTMLDY